MQKKKMRREKFGEVWMCEGKGTKKKIEEKKIPKSSRRLQTILKASIICTTAFILHNYLFPLY